MVNIAKEEQQTPKHVGLILDGNRRWATQKGLPKLEGHRAGYNNLKVILEAATTEGVEYLSAFVFSTENWKRSIQEVRYLMNLLSWLVTHEISEFQKRNARLVWLGSREKMSPKLVKQIEQAEQATAQNSGVTLCLCLNHGGQKEIVESIRRLAASGADIRLVNENDIAQNLDHPEVPPVDLIIRTSGEQRLSNFMLWRAAYAELLFVDTYWPDFTPNEFRQCLVKYKQRKRRYGG